MYTAHMCVCVCVRKCSFNPTDEWRTPIRLSYATGVSIGRNTQMADLCRAAETWLPTGSQQTRDRKGKIDKRSSGKRLQTVGNMMDERIFWLNVASLFLFLILQISFFHQSFSFHSRPAFFISFDLAFNFSIIQRWCHDLRELGKYDRFSVHHALEKYLHKIKSVENMLPLNTLSCFFSFLFSLEYCHSQTSGSFPTCFP